MPIIRTILSRHWAGMFRCRALLCFKERRTGGAGPIFWLCTDNKPLSARNDVLMFQTPPLEIDIEVTGRLIMKLWAS